MKKMVGILQGSGGAGSGNLVRYIANLYKQIGCLRPVQVSAVEFVTTSGSVATLIDDESISIICEAYVEGLVSGSLHPQTVPVAQRAYELQKSWARLGLRAHILSASGVAPKTAMGQIRSLADKIFLREPREFEVLYNTELVDAIRRVYRMPRLKNESKRIPQWMAAIFSKLYKKFLGIEGYVLLKRRNPNPSSATVLHHQWLIDAILAEIKDHRAAIIYIANRSGGSKKYFWDQIDELLGISRQQSLPGAA
jgi:hypothetical protein